MELNPWPEADLGQVIWVGSIRRLRIARSWSDFLLRYMAAVDRGWLVWERGRIRACESLRQVDESAPDSVYDLLDAVPGLGLYEHSYGPRKTIKVTYEHDYTVLPDIDDIDLPDLSAWQPAPSPTLMTAKLIWRHLFGQKPK